MNEDAAPSRVKRMLPSVSEVLKELTSRAPVEPDVAFRAAREVCAEELKRIRDAGGDSVPLEELVQRALARVSGGRPGMAVPTTVVLPPEPPPVESLPLVPSLSGPEPFAAAAAPPALVDDGPIPLEPAPLEPEPAAPAADGDDPFGETAGAMDLRWDREARGPFVESAAGPAPFILPAEPEEGPAAGEAGTYSPDLAAEGEVVEGPGDETLSRLSREAESIDLNTVFPRPGAGPTSGSVGGPPSPDPVAAPFEDDEDTVLTIPRGGRSRAGAGPRLGAILGIAAGLVILAGIGYLLVGLWMERDATPPPVAVARPRPTPAPVASTTPAAPADATTGAVPGSASATPVAAATAAPSAAPATPTAPAAAPTPVAARPARTAPPVPTVAATAAAPAPTLVRPVRQSRDGLVVTRDRAGRPEVWSIHFTSYRDRASAERDLKRVERLAGRPGYVAEVDLGEKGLWYRVMAGEFPSAQEAKAAREELVAKGTPDLGWVYRVVGSE